MTVREGGAKTVFLDKAELQPGERSQVVAMTSSAMTSSFGARQASEPSHHLDATSLSGADFLHHTVLGGRPCLVR